ncbi:hypothetical protein KRP22_008927 [Phytophthora ramorum]|nr:hypothetical protein KRP22_7759 [Phytophthora ramorum]
MWLHGRVPEDNRVSYDCRRTNAMSRSFLNLTQEAQVMSRPAWWDEDVERLAEEVWLPVAEDSSERSGEPGGELALPLVGTSFFGLRNLSNQSGPVLHDDAVNSCIKIELDPTPQQPSS